MQELFQCKLTRKGTIAPSDRQSRLRKSMANTFENQNSTTNGHSNDSDTFESINSPSVSDLNNLNEHHGIANRGRFATSSVSSIHNNNNINGSNGRNPPAIYSVKNGSNKQAFISASTAAIDDEHRNSVNSHVFNIYASDKALPLTVACHFKVNNILLNNYL